MPRRGWIPGSHHVGTDESPGPVICTVSGGTIHHGVAEFAIGTPLSIVIATLGGGMPPERAIKYVLSGISNPVLRADHLDTPVSYEVMDAIGSGLGTAGFIGSDDRTDPAELDSGRFQLDKRQAREQLDWTYLNP